MENERYIDSIRRKQEGRDASFSREKRREKESQEKKGFLEVSIEKSFHSFDKMNSYLELKKPISPEKVSTKTKKRRGREERTNSRITSQNKTQEQFIHKLGDYNRRILQKSMEKIKNKDQDKSQLSSQTRAEFSQEFVMHIFELSYNLLDPTREEDKKG